MNKEELKEKYGKKRVPHQWRDTDIVSTMVCTFFGSGMSPKAPGTMGSLAAAVVAYPMALLFAKINWPTIFPEGFFAFILSDCEICATDFQNCIPCLNYYPGINIAFLAAALIVFFAAIPFVNKAMRDTKTDDPGWIVIDEVCGIFMTFAFVSTGVILAHPWLLAIGFGLFRFFDILKPLGIHRFEKFPGAWGVMADDLLGGIYAGILMAVIAFFSG